MEKVWVAEQKSEQEQKRLAEFQKQLLEERQIQELRQLQAAQGQVIKHTDNSLDWMYEGPGGGSQVQKDSEEYLLGKIYKPQQSSTFEVGSARKFFVVLPCFVFELIFEFSSKYFIAIMSQSNSTSSTWVNKVSNKNDIFSRKHEDPMIVIKQAEKAQRDRVVNNPIQMERIRQNVAKHLEEMDYMRDRSRRATDELQSHRDAKHTANKDDDDSSSESRHHSRKSHKKKHKKHKKEKRRHRYDSDEDASNSSQSDHEERKRKRRDDDDEDDSRSRSHKKRTHSDHHRRSRSRSRSSSPQEKHQFPIETAKAVVEEPQSTLTNNNQSSKGEKRKERSSSPPRKRDDRSKDMREERSNYDSQAVKDIRDDHSSHRDDRRRRDSRSRSRSRSPPRRERYYNERERDRHSRERRHRDSRDRERRHRDNSRDRRQRTDEKASKEVVVDKYGRDRERERERDHRDRSRSPNRTHSTRENEEPKEESKSDSLSAGTISERKSWGLVFKGRQAPNEKDENGVKSLGPSAELLRKKEEARQQEEKLRQENLRRARGYTDRSSSHSHSVSEEERLARLRAMTQDAEVVDSNRLIRTVKDAGSEGDFKEEAIRAQQAGKSAEFISHMRSEVLRSAGETTGIKERLDTHKHYVQRGAALDDSNAGSFLKR